MSPEQVLGQPADARSDIFAFGTILYEMLSGARAFHRERAAATSFAILRDEPSPLPETVPARLREAVARCLRKVPAQRFASARELATALDELRPTGEMPAVGHSSRSRRWLIAVVALSLTLAGAGGFTAWKIAHRAPPSFRQLTFHPGAVWSARFGPDGKQVFYGAAWDANPPRIFVTVPGNPEPAKVQVEDGQLLAVSPTGELAMLARPAFKQVAFSQGMLTVGKPGAGPPAEVSPEVDAADFVPDGSLAVVRQKEHRSVLELPPGHEIAASPGWISDPRVSRDGKLVAFIEHPSTFDDGGVVKVSDRTGNTLLHSRSFRSALGLAWSPRGDEIWFTAAAGEAGSKSALRSVDLGGNERVLTQVGGDLKLEDVSNTGRVLVTMPERRLGVALRRADSERGIDLSWFDRANLVDLATDGSGVLLTVAGAAGGNSYSIYYRASDGSPARRLGDGLAGALSPDGSLALALSGSRDLSLSLLPLKRSGPPRALGAHGIAVSRARFFPDGRQLLLIGSQSGRRTRLYKLGIDDTTDPLPISGEDTYATVAVISPDGKDVATVAEDSRTVIYPSSGGTPRRFPQLKPGEWPFGWGIDHTLYFGRVNVLPVSIDRLDLETGRRTPWLTLFPEASGATHITRVLVNSDASVIAYNYASITTHLYMLQGLN
jgi:WD40 repeat protein